MVWLHTRIQQKIRYSHLTYCLVCHRFRLLLLRSHYRLLATYRAILDGIGVRPVVQIALLR